LKAWYVANGVWGFISVSFLYWFSNNQLAHGYQTKWAIAVTYVLELGYIVLSIIAWCMLSSDPTNSCQTDAPSLVELMVDMIILLYMRSLRLMSILVFLVICGLPVLYCYLKHRPRPTQDPAQLKANLNVVTLGVLHQLRNMNYRHKATSEAKKKNKSGELNQGLLSAPNPTLDSQSPNDVSEYGIDMTCCICMENFGEESGQDIEVGNPYSNVEVVILPCKAHYFH
jgi:hypothetical protein